MKNVVLLILDGYGLAQPGDSNAISLARKPHLDALMAKYPHTQLQASGLAVGLPEGQMGNSEVGHQNIGAGKIVYQSLTTIDVAIKDGSFFHNPAYLKAIAHVKKHHSNMHICGLLSDGGVHSHINHLKALLDLCKKEGVSQVYFEAFLDGRDVDPRSAVHFLGELQAYMTRINYGVINTVGGRYYGMDRDKNFDRIDRAYQNLVAGQGVSFSDPVSYVVSQYEKGITDEFVEPAHQVTMVPLADNDALIHANFRPDRAIQFSTIITNPDYYPQYQPRPKLSNVCLIQTFPYADSVKGEIAFHNPTFEHILGTVVGAAGKKQLRIAETEKYAHVTFFLDGGVNYDGLTRPLIPGCDRILVNSPKVATYDLAPAMAAEEVTDLVVKAIGEEKYDLIICNLANCDMVGHTAVKEAVIQAVEVVDACVGRISRQIAAHHGLLLLTADHGNADKIIDESGQPFTAHTTAPVPFLVGDEGCSLRTQGILADIAPTILSLLKIKIPEEMSGRSLIVNA